MNTPTHKPPFLIGGIADLLRWFELLIFTVSAPVLSVATVIAVTDLLTGGRLLATQPGLVFAFGVALAIGIDSQLPAACERVRDAWEDSPKRWLTLLLWAVIAAWTGMVIFSALRAFSIEQAQHVDETTALAIIGIDPGLFAAQRDLLAVVLLGLSGFARVKARAISRAEEREQLTRELEMEPLRQQVEQLKARRVVNAVATGRAAVDAFTSTQNAHQPRYVDNPDEQSTNTPTDNTSATPEPPQQPVERVSDIDMERIAERKREWDATHAQTDADNAPHRPPTGGGSPSASKSPKPKPARAERPAVLKLQPAPKERAARRKVAARGSAERRIREILTSEPDIAFSELVRRADVSESTGSKWLAVFEAERASQQAAQ